MRTWTILALGLLLTACTTKSVPDDNGTGGSAGGESDAGGSGGTAGSGGAAGLGGAGGSSEQDGGGVHECAGGFVDCDGDATNGCETDAAADTNNCGACGQVCAAGQVCVSGACGTPWDAGDAPACPTSHADCNGNASDGCEADLQNEVANCGTCGYVCAIGQQCNQGACVLDTDGGDAGACGPGFGDCDGDVTNGCETYLGSNENNCGACGQVCAGGQVCVNGACGSAWDGGACGQGFGDCDGDVTNGCETYLMFDKNNCGACGVACAGTEACVSGVCTVPATDAGPATCDVFTNDGCQPGYACNVLIPYYTSADVLCRPAGNVAADQACSPQALCAPGTGCVPNSPNFTGDCRTYCGLGGGPNGCPSNEHCASILHPSIGICVP